MKKRILFFCEAVTLSHVVQPIVLAKALEGEYDIYFACSEDRNAEIKKAGFKTINIFSQASRDFARKLYNGSVIFDDRLIKRYLEEEIRIINSFKPDIVVGDFRITLKISAQVCSVPYVAINNYYWSKYCEKQNIDLPDGLIKKYLGKRAGKIFFDVFFPLVSRAHIAPFRSACAKYGLKKPKNINEMYCSGDYVIYGDIKEIFEKNNAPENHVFLGPILWEPDMEIPQIILDNSDKKMIYYSPGSSGRQDKKVIEVLKDFDGIILITKAAQKIACKLYPNMLTFDYLPAIKISKMKNLVLAITNGGVSTYTFLKNGVPVFTNPSNMYQHLFSKVLSNSYFDILREDSQLTLLFDRIEHESLPDVKHYFEKYDLASIFNSVVKKALSG